MGYSNGIITAPVSIYDVQQAIGASSPDLGTLCKHTNINKWSKHKPVVSSVVGVLSDAQLREQNFVRSGQTIQTFYGLKVKNSPNVVDVGCHDVSYDYYKPQGGDSEKYRLHDFGNYQHNAAPSVYGSNITRTADAGATENVITCTVNYSKTTNGVDILEFSASAAAHDITQYYAACLFSTLSGTTYQNTYIKLMCTTSSGNTHSTLSNGINVRYIDIPSAVRGQTGTFVMTFLLLHKNATPTLASDLNDWVSLANWSGVVLAYPPVCLPDAIKQSITLTSSFVRITVYTPTVPSTRIKITFDCVCASVIPQDERQYYYATLHIDTVDVSTSPTMTYSNLALTLEWSLMDDFFGGLSRGQHSVTMYIWYRKGSGSANVAGSWTGTINVT